MADIEQHYQNADRTLDEQEAINVMARKLCADIAAADFDTPTLADIALRIAELQQIAFRNPRHVSLESHVYVDLKEAKQLGKYDGNPHEWAIAAVDFCIEKGWLKVVADNMDRAPARMLTPPGYERLAQIRTKEAPGQGNIAFPAPAAAVHPDTWKGWGEEDYLTVIFDAGKSGITAAEIKKKLGKPDEPSTKLKELSRAKASAAKQAIGRRLKELKGDDDRYFLYPTE